MRHDVLERMFVWLGYAIEYIFASGTKAAVTMSSNVGTGIVSHPTLAGAAMMGGGMGVAFAYYSFRRNLEKAVRKIAGAVLAMVFFIVSFSMLLVAYAPPLDGRPMNNVTNSSSLNMTNSSLL